MNGYAWAGSTAHWFSSCWIWASYLHVGLGFQSTGLFSWLQHPLGSLNEEGQADPSSVLVCHCFTVCQGSGNWNCHGKCGGFLDCLEATLWTGSHSRVNPGATCALSACLPASTWGCVSRDTSSQPCLCLLPKGELFQDHRCGLCICGCSLCFTGAKQVGELGNCHSAERHLEKAAWQPWVMFYCLGIRVPGKQFSIVSSQASWRWWCYLISQAPFI